MPVERASTVVFDDLEAFEQRVERLYDGFSYGLYGTPTSRQRAVSLHQTVHRGGPAVDLDRPGSGPDQGCRPGEGKSCR